MFNRNARGQPGWVRIYRALNHRQAERACSSQETRSFPDEIQDFAELFATLQDKRHQADYDPLTQFTKTQVLRLIVDTRGVLNAFGNATRQDRRSFATLVLFRARN